MVVMLMVINVASLSISRTITVFQGLTAFGVPVEIVEFISLAKVALFRGFPFPGATAFTFGGRDLYDGPVVLRVSLNPHDPTGLVVCQGFVADGASAGDRTAFGVLGAALEDALLLGHGYDLHDSRLAVASITGHGLLRSFQPLGPSGAAFGGGAYVFLRLLRDVH